MVMNALASPEPLFSDFRVRCGGDGGAREMFQNLVTDLVDAVHPDLAMDVAGPGGSDWGIDTYVGSLDGSAHVWQTKFFLPFTQDQQNQVRSSFAEVLKRAEKEQFRVASWTLCVPSVLPPDQQQWFDGWSGRQSKKHGGIGINIWNGRRLRRILMSSDASEIRQNYFESSASPVVAYEQVAQHPEIDSYELNALFVRQLLEAGYPETDSARGAYFATDALLRTLKHRGDPKSLQALEELTGEAHFIWEAAFAAAKPDEDGRMVTFVNEVLSNVGALGATADLNVKPMHRRGVTHRLVEYSRAGWVSNWREIAERHGTRKPSEYMEPNDG